MRSITERPAEAEVVLTEASPFAAALPVASVIAARAPQQAEKRRFFEPAVSIQV